MHKQSVRLHDPLFLRRSIELDELQGMLRVGGIEFWRRGTEIVVDVPLGSPTALFFRREGGSLELATTFLPGWGDRRDITSCAAMGYLQFGVLLPTVDLWPGVGRLAPGQRYAIRLGSFTVEKLEGTVLPSCAAVDRGRFIDGSLEQEREIVRLIDLFLETQVPDRRPVVLFSGGVDSSLIAARAAAMGWKETLLVNYAISADDPESKHAEYIASELGLPFCRVIHDGMDAAKSLRSVVRSSPLPFADHSVLPTRRLCEIVKERYPDRVVVDGTGADGCFGLAPRVRAWARMYKIPRAARAVGGVLYEKGRLWMGESPAERVGRLLRRSSQMPVHLSAVAQNPLEGILYLGPHGDARNARSSLTGWVRDDLALDEPLTQIVGLDLALICAGMFAQKSQPAFHKTEQRIIFPFLDDSMVNLAIGGATLGGSRQPKKAMKRALSRHIPKELVYRRKSGFVVPLRDIFESEDVRMILNWAFSSDGPVWPYLVEDNARAAVRALLAGRFLPVQTVGAIWGVVFLSLWMDDGRAI